MSTVLAKMCCCQSLFPASSEVLNTFFASNAQLQINITPETTGTMLINDTGIDIPFKFPPLVRYSFGKINVKITDMNVKKNRQFLYVLEVSIGKFANGL